MKTEVVIVAGDFNTAFENNRVPSEKTLLNLLQDGYFWPFEGIPLSRSISMPGFGKYPDACFDHIFLRGMTDRPVAEVVSNAKGSDHFPVVVQFRIS